MLKINRKLSKRGFTLVELMVAVAILAIAALGIFQSYQVGFWGMSDARARTIATNIAQEKLEEVKGKSLAAGTYPDPENPLVVSGKDFNAVVTVEDIMEGVIPTTLKKIITKVSWQKRNGEETNIQVEGLQSKALAPPSTDAPTAILISANPPEMDVGETSTIQVTILDQDNYPISFDGQINLSMIPDTPNNLGTLDDDVLDFNGESFLTTIFMTNVVGVAGDVEISAEDDSNELIPDSVTITIIGGEPESIILVADPDSIIINGDTSVLTVRIEDENHFLADNWTGIVQLTINPDGQDTGDLGDPPVGDTITIEFNEENVKTTLFTSSIQDGEAVITATDITSSTPLIFDTETIYISSGPPYQIDIAAEPNSIFIQEYEGGATSSTITVTIKNETGVEVSGFEGTVSLSLLSGNESGSLAENILTFSGQSSLYTIFNSTTTPGVVEIEATDSTSGGPGYVPLISDTESLTIAAGPPDHIEINAVPDIILNDGSDFSTLTIYLKDGEGNYSSFDEEKELIFTLYPDKGTVKNTPLILPAGHSQISTTYVCADSEFEDNVVITVACESMLSTAAIQVFSKVIRPSEDPNIRYGETWQWVRDGWRYYYRLVEDPSKILFNIDVLGGTINITQIDLAWKDNGEPPSERLREITIFETDNPSNVKFYRAWSSSYWSGNYYPEIPIFEDLYEIYFDGFDVNDEEGTYTVELYYNQDIESRTIIIQFHGTYEGRFDPVIYQLEFLSPDLIV